MITGTSAVDFRPYPTNLSTSLITRLPDSVLLYLFQSFSDAYTSLVTTASSTANAFDPARGTIPAGYTNTLRKIRPGEVTIPDLPANVEGDQTVMQLFNYNTRIANKQEGELLHAFSIQHAEEYNLFHTMTVLHLRKKGEMMVNEAFLTAIMEEKYESYASLIEQFYSKNEFKMFKSNQDATVIASKEVEALFTQIEYCVLWGVHERLRGSVVEEVVKALSILPIFGK